MLDLDVPVIEVVFALFNGDAAKLDGALAKAFDLHRRYWSRSGGDRTRTNLAAARGVALGHGGPVPS